jgi:16S rRNA (guanine527-N7)-methyltransferase
MAEFYALPAGAVAQLTALVAVVAGDPHAPTTVHEPQAILDDHLADSLVALQLPPVRQARVIADLGAGGGFPGLPLAIALPEARVWLVESVGRKCAFIDATAAALGLDNAAAVNDRAETWAAGIGGCDLVTARALAPLDVVAEYAAPLLRVGGHLVAWRGKREAEVEAKSLRAAEILGLSVEEPLRVVPYPGAEHRHLHVMSKVRETPGRFPRRPGMARKRPLGNL